MNSFTVFLAFVLVTVAVAEPQGYNYQRPSGGGGGGGFSSGGSFSSGGGSFSSGGSSFSSGGGGGYQAVPHGTQTSEGQNVDPQLLEQIRQILLKEESQSGGHGGGGGGHGGGAPSGQYGVPSPQYGVPSHQSRVVGIDLEGVRQAIQVAQFLQTSHSQSSGGFSGYPSGGASRPSSSYGAPF
ncbi:keratin, type I cytoskeletal 10 [Phlebotomus argentipes]|uniref:keratin, type I cytoskeletal 10 n=1 Tax=Phlebotomus argentipes TaxID=94469 RepID=UPI0028935692|nr:keratin, type I cytoskeletal 10 [Phlebotomus argentipes]